MTSTASFEKRNDPAFGQTPEAGARTALAGQRQSEPRKLLHLIHRDPESVSLELRTPAVRCAGRFTVLDNERIGGSAS